MSESKKVVKKKKNPQWWAYQNDTGVNWACSQSPKLEQSEQENKWNPMDYNPKYKILINMSYYESIVWTMSSDWYK